MEKLSIVLVGIGGYGNGYVEQLLKNRERGDFELAGVVDPYPHSSQSWEILQQMQVPYYATLEEFYQVHQADVAIISSPINFHYQQTAVAVLNGSHVLCEKPVTATVQDAYAMMEARDKAEKMVGIGYQWSFNAGIQALKQDIMAGVFGEPVRMKTLVLWPRDKTYYGRGWAGKVKTDSGDWILDSVANNATAHFLHNMFYVLGDKIDRSADLETVAAQLYRTNDIENYDTALIKAVTTNQVEILFYASHAVNHSIGPLFEYEFTKGTVYFNSDTEKQIIAKLSDGSQKVYGNPELEPRRKMWQMIDSVKYNQPVPCGIEAALTQTVCINATQESCPDIGTFPADLRVYDTEREVNYVSGLAELLQSCYTAGRMLTTDDATWVKQGQVISVTDYKRFPSQAK